MSAVLASGTFVSQAHETKGTAELVEVDGKKYLQLRDFHTSNGPDVRVYLVKGSSANPSSVKAPGSIDLGSIKGNIGDQAYELPAGIDLDEYGAVSIWCERFAVGFGGAMLSKAEPVSVQTNGGSFQLAGFGQSVEVTFGTAMGDKRFTGRASVIEEKGKRYVDLDFKKVPEGAFTARFVMKENLALGAFPKDAKFVDLGKLAAKRTKVGVSKDLDIWLYRTIAIIDSKTGKVVSWVPLRSAQEGKGSLLLA